jgi:hypothetical protein
MLEGPPQRHPRSCHVRNASVGSLIELTIRFPVWLPRFLSSPPWSTPIAAAPRCGPRTPWWRSTRPDPRRRRSRARCAAVARRGRWSCITTRRSIGRTDPAGAARGAHGGGARPRSMPGSGSSPAGGRVPFAAQGWGIPSAAAGAVPVSGPAHHRSEVARGQRSARATVDEVRAARAVERVAIGSFFGPGASRTCAATSRGSRPAPAREETRWALYRSWCTGRCGDPPTASSRCRAIGPDHHRDDPGSCATHSAGLRSRSGRSTSGRDIDRLLAWGVDAIITDRPDVAVRRGTHVRGRPAAVMTRSSLDAHPCSYRDGADTGKPRAHEARRSFSGDRRLESGTHCSKTVQLSASHRHQETCMATAACPRQTRSTRSGC